MILTIYIIGANGRKGKYTNNKKALVPWTSLSRDLNREYVRADCLPEGLTLMDPSKLRTMDISMMWDVWAKRQREGNVGLVFLQAHGGDMHEKAVDKGDGKSRKKDINRGGQEDQNLVRDQEGSGENGMLSGTTPPAADSPAAHNQSQSARKKFLAGLCNDNVYLKHLGYLSKLKVSSYIGSSTLTF